MLSGVLENIPDERNGLLARTAAAIRNLGCRARLILLNSMHVGSHLVAHSAEDSQRDRKSHSARLQQVGPKGLFQYRTAATCAFATHESATLCDERWSGRRGSTAAGKDRSRTPPAIQRFCRSRAFACRVRGFVKAVGGYRYSPRP